MFPVIVFCPAFDENPHDKVIIWFNKAYSLNVILRDKYRIR